MTQPTLRTVSVVFCDLVDSVGLASRLSEHAMYDEVLQPFYETAERVIAEHGGTMRPVFAGDKVLAVFGAPMEQPDDALRAVEAAVALRAKVAELSERLKRDRDAALEIHTGVNTGTALIRNPDGDPTAAFGDAPNVGARLQDAAGPGEILLGEGTHELVMDVVLAEPVPLIVRGKRSPLTGWRLVHVDRGGVSRGARIAAPLVGRELELALLHWAYQRVLREQTCHVVNVLGLAGVGKSRLVEEFLRSLDSAPKVLRGFCQPYGPGITYFPIMQLVQQAAEVGPDDTNERIHELVMDVVGHERTTDKVMRLFGEPGSLIERDDILRGVQRMFESMARRRPLVIVIEDLHAAQPASLDAIRRLVDALRDSRILIVCMARSEFLADGGTLGASNPNMHYLTLYPLPEDKVEQMVGHLLGGGDPPERLQELVRAWAGGNPFYLQELVGNLIDETTLKRREGRWELHGDLSDLRKIPPTPRIEAVLGARLSRLEDAERTLIHRAAVIGMQFRQAGVLAILPEDVDPGTVPAILAGLVRKEVLVHDSSTPVRSGGEGVAFTFKHMLIQDTAYRRIDKATRSDLHRRYADWLEQSKRPSASVLEQIGFHLDTAYQDWTEELGREDDRARLLARRAGEFLARAGHGYVRQGDFPKLAVDSLRRAVELLPEDHERRLAARLDLAEALRDDGDAEARSVFDAVVEAARQAKDTAVEMHAVLGRLELEWFQDSWGGWEQGRQELDRAIWEFVRLGDNLGLAKAHRLSAHGHMSLGESAKARQAAERAVEFVRRTDRVRLEAKILRLYCLILFWGPAPLEEVVRKNEEALEWARARRMSSLEARALELLARTAAMRGDFGEARRLSKEARNIIPDLGELLTNASDSISEGLIELLADDLDAAERALRKGYEALVQRGARGPLANVAANLARVLLLKEQYDEAEELALMCKEIAAESQLDTQIKWRALLAVIDAHRGNAAQAVGLAREAVDKAEGSEQPDSQAEAFVDLAGILRAVGEADEARRYTDRALQLYELKGNLVAAARVRRALELDAQEDEGRGVTKVTGGLSPT